MPRLPEPTTDQVQRLAAIEQAVKHRIRVRADADRRYVESIYAAADSGLTATQIAPATGVSYQAVQKILAKRTLAVDEPAEPDQEPG